jgi:hypothetical protein
VLGLGKVKLAGAEEAEEGLVVEAVVADRLLGSNEVGGDVALGSELLAEGLEDRLLLLGAVGGGAGKRGGVRGIQRARARS